MTHIILVIPGLGHLETLTVWAVRRWKWQTLTPKVYNVDWYDVHESFEDKLSKLLTYINLLKRNEATVSLIGLSAGGSFAVNAFVRQPKKIKHVICICAQLRRGTSNGFQSFDRLARTSTIFRDSVLACETSTTKLTTQEKNKITTFHALFGDELVPPDTTIIQGAENLKIPTGEHVLSITAVMTIFSRRLFNALKK